MRRPFRALLLLSSSILAIPALGIIAYDITYYETNRDEVLSVIANATSEERNLPMPMATFVRAEFKNGTAPYSARLLINHLGIVHQPVSAGRWAVIYALWSALVRLHLTAEERMTVIAVLAPTGINRQGLSSTSRAEFGKPLSELKPKDARLW
jgi:hypothetical protein